MELGHDDAERDPIDSISSPVADHGKKTNESFSAPRAVQANTPAITLHTTAKRHNLPVAQDRRLSNEREAETSASKKRMVAPSRAEEELKQTSAEPLSRKGSTTSSISDLGQSSRPVPPDDSGLDQGVDNIALDIDAASLSSNNAHTTANQLDHREKTPKGPPIAQQDATALPSPLRHVPRHLKVDAITVPTLGQANRKEHSHALPSPLKRSNMINQDRIPQQHHIVTKETIAAHKQGLNKITPVVQAPSIKNLVTAHTVNTTLTSSMKRRSSSENDKQVEKLRQDGEEEDDDDEEILMRKRWQRKRARYDAKEDEANEALLRVSLFSYSIPDFEL